MRKPAVFFLLSVASAPSLAGPFDDINYECRQLDAKRDGIKCLVRYEGSQPILYIRYLRASREGTKDQQERTRYIVSTTQRNFVALGGVTILRRFTLDGIPAQQLCTSFHRRPIVCGDPIKLKDLDGPQPWPF